jgi:lysophospholipase L1-like esterase
VAQPPRLTVGTYTAGDRVDDWGLGVVTVRRNAHLTIGLACLTVAAAALFTGCTSDDPASAPPTSAGRPNGSAEASLPSTGGFDTGEIESEYAGSGPALVVLGDSIADQSRAELHRVLDPHYRTKIAALTGEGFGNGPLSAASGDGRALMLEAATDYARDDPVTVVIALGTNDAWNPRLGLDAAQAAMDDMVAMFPDSCVVGVEVSEWSEAENYDREEARALNEQLRTLVDVVVPALPPSDVGADMIHPRPEGRTAFAHAVASGVGECGSG